MKKTAAILLCLCMMLGMASCGSNANGDIPDGMQIASCAGADYYLYVPTSWNLNTHYGVSGAYFHLERVSNVSVVRYEQTGKLLADMTAATLPDTAGDRIDWYYNTQCKPAVESLAWEGTYEQLKLENDALLLGDANARQYRAKMTVGGKEIINHHVIAERGAAFYVFTFAVETDMLDMLWDAVATMIKEFKFTDEPYMPEAVKEIEEDPDAPEGMKRASNDEVAYALYVPTAWKINQNERVFSAYVEADRSNVSVVPYMPSNEELPMTLDQYFEKMIENLKSSNKDIQYLEVAPSVAMTMGGRDAATYRYRLTIDGKTYEYLQVVTYYKGNIYNLTYTALPEHFEAHRAEVDQIISAFRFL